MHETLQSFAHVGFNKVAGAEMSSTATAEEGSSLFTTDIELVTFVSAASTTNDKRKDVVLLRGARKVANVYRSLALFREAAGGDWTTLRLSADIERQSLIVSWRTETPLQIEGTDSFVFESPSVTSSYYRLPLESTRISMTIQMILSH